MPCIANAQLRLKNNALDLQWKRATDGLKLSSIAVSGAQGWQQLAAPSGAYTLLYSKEKPATDAVPVLDAKGAAVDFPEQHYRYLTPIWKQATSPVEMNIAGEAIRFFPSSVEEAPGRLIFAQEEKLASIRSQWEFDKVYANDIKVNITVRAKRDGYFSMSSPTLAVLNKNNFNWASVPGVLQGNAIEPSFINAFAYGQGIPDKPVVLRERTASTLSPLVTTKENITLAVIPDPGIARDPWASNEKSIGDWFLGLSLMNRNAELMPTIYHPVLGEKKSFLKAGDSIVFSFRYTIRNGSWFPVFKHAVNDVYRFADALALKQTKQSLTSRLLGMHRYVIDDSLSKWRTEAYKGITIGAQDYLGGVYNSDKDAMKNADYGAMWMLSKITEDTVLQSTRLPYARNFKLMQQNTGKGFFHGAAAGQYYLFRSKRFTEEWGDYSEPIALTYYMIADMGNILLFQPNDTALKSAFREAADRLLHWMQPNGQWQVAYDNHTAKPMFTEVQDLRPTFYGMLVAYNILGDVKYKAAACKGADWFIKNAVERGRFLGTCGDARFVPDFATGQSVQALMDLYAATKDARYKNAAIATAKIYTTSVYTHPIPDRTKKMVNGIAREDWEIAQAGLSFEHGGTLGSANHRGPILLASHAGMFIRMFAITKDSIFLNMARAAALGRDAFVDSATSVASYYWDAMNKGAGPYPHHAWWQVGWITDYLLAEISLRSGNGIEFPRGFITPKVGPHQSYGFKEGTVYGTKASLLLKENMLHINDPYIDHFAAIDTKNRKLFLMLLNNDDEKRSISVQLDPAHVLNNKSIQLLKVLSRKDSRHTTPMNNFGSWSLNIPAYGLQVIEINYR
ncbi:glycerophosphoryl diester phosphodiesterase [Pseudoflavitalea sp. G-6-1-2]|nr:glycerophosphoryl diester phosphodiesterase [Pseudoflavitalea sp. G-6-1-2]